MRRKPNPLAALAVVIAVAVVAWWTGGNESRQTQTPQTPRTQAPRNEEQRQLDATQHLAGIALNGGGVATMPANGNRYLFTKNLSVNASGKLDLVDNDLLWDYSSTSVYATARQLVLNGRDNVGGVGGIGLPIVDLFAELGAGQPCGHLGFLGRAAVPIRGAGAVGDGPGPAGTVRPCQRIRALRAVPEFALHARITLQGRGKFHGAG